VPVGGSGGRESQNDQGSEREGQPPHGEHRNSAGDVDTNGDIVDALRVRVERAIDQEDAGELAAGVCRMIAAGAALDEAAL
jgi:hypothetical protein